MIDTSMNLEKESIFGTKQEEIEYLQKQLEEAKKEAEVERQIERGKEIIRQHSEIPQETIGKEYAFSSEEKLRRVENLKEEPHQKQVEALLRIAEEKGVWNATQIVKGIRNDHLTDDFQRNLVSKFFGIKLR